MTYSAHGGFQYDSCSMYLLPSNLTMTIIMGFNRKESDSGEVVAAHEPLHLRR